MHMYVHMQLCIDNINSLKCYDYSKKDLPIAFVCINIFNYIHNYCLIGDYKEV